jgi:hypothetical protein
MRKRLLAAARPLHHAASNSRPSFFTITMYFQESTQSLNNLQPTAKSPAAIPPAIVSAEVTFMSSKQKRKQARLNGAKAAGKKSSRKQAVQLVLVLKF